MPDHSPKSPPAKPRIKRKREKFWWRPTASNLFMPTWYMTSSMSIPMWFPDTAAASNNGTCPITTPMTVAKMVANQRHQLFSPDFWIFKNMPDLWFHGFPFYKPVAKIEKP